VGKQSDGWEAANFRSSVEQKGPRSSYADEIGKSGEGRGGERTEVRGTEKVKKKKRKQLLNVLPHPFILFQRAGSVSNQKVGAPFGPRECVSFFLARSFPPSSLLRNPPFMCRIPTKGSGYARAREDRSVEGMGRDNPTNPDNEPDGARRHSGTD